MPQASIAIPRRDKSLIDPNEDIDLDGPGGTSDFATTWTNAGPVNLTDTDATVKDGQRTYLTQMTVTIGNPSAGDALSAVVTGTNIDVQGIGSTHCCSMPSRQSIPTSW